MIGPDQTAAHLAWWRDNGPAVVAADHAISDAARVWAGEHGERIPTDREIARLRAVREHFATVPNHPGFHPAHTLADEKREQEVGMARTGMVYPLGDQDDGRDLFEREAETVAVSEADGENIRLRESSFVFVCKNRAGEIVEAEAKEKADRAQKELNDCGINLAIALSSAGVPAFLPSSSPRASIVCPESERRIDLAPFRRINFLPPIAKARRDPVVKQLEAFAEREGNCRMAVFTAGPRIPLIGQGAEVRAATQFLHRRISELNSHPLLKSHGCVMHFRATEYGTISLASPWPRVPGTESGIPWVHLHTHVVYSFAHQLSPRRWKRFLAKMHNLWRYHWSDSGKLRDVREACKYPIKPGDYSHLTNEQIAAFYHATKGLHLVQPLGEFRAEIAERREAALKAVRLRNGDRKLELRFKPDWNARIDRLTGPEKNGRAQYREQQRRRGLSVFIKAARLFEASRELYLVAALTLRGARISSERRQVIAAALIAEARALGALAQSLLLFNPRPFEEERLSAVPKLKALAAMQRGPVKMRDRIAARLAPAPYFDRITRPALLVWNFSGDYAGLRSHGFVREYLDAVRPQIRRAERAASFLNVHTSHTTVGRTSGDLPLLERSEAWQTAGPPDPAALAGVN